MAFPVTPATLSDFQSIDALTEAEAGIIQCMATLFCNTLLTNIQAISNTTTGGTLENNIEVRAELVKDILCTYACKEISIADLINSIACKLAVDKGLIKSECDCGCDF
ncbi:hypothetical protein [Oceanirhabdus seepicola]|uniref:Uncharacterized protein n=1 Tax=Oceanirhabdus seepicola TaxID=2828781 RepID=A0A9J6NXJ5_9CLOT|nr:hypothetical protein [Oceanirhabdus seepicola]MCM1989231.1 hypothetical protein [Oceanirhabdus seepicola]